MLKEAIFQWTCRYTRLVDDIIKEIEPEPETQFSLSVEETLELLQLEFRMPNEYGAGSLETTSLGKMGHSS